jgi:hypothetical protein
VYGAYGTVKFPGNKFKFIGNKFKFIGNKFKFPGNKFKFIGDKFKCLAAKFKRGGGLDGYLGDLGGVAVVSGTFTKAPVTSGQAG